MKALYLLRHAKSSWEDASLSDLERPLNERGRRTAPFMGELMKERGLLPDTIVSSPAVRAEETAQAVKEAAGLQCEIVWEPDIYEAGPNDLHKIIAGLNDKFSSAMLVGHNPGMEGIVNYLTGSMGVSMPTAALAVIELDIEKWSEVNDGCGRLITLIRPKDEMR